MEERSMSDYWFEQFLNEAKLMGSRCTTCDALFAPPRALCTKCHGSNMEWVEMKGIGILTAFTCISIGTPVMIAEGYDRNKPYCSGVVKLAEGPRVVARIEDVDTLHPENIKVGTPLRVAFLPRGGGENRKTDLAFRPCT